jgi:hypothetical protein
LTTFVLEGVVMGPTTKLEVVMPDRIKALEKLQMVISETKRISKAVVSACKGVGSAATVSA